MEASHRCKSPQIPLAVRFCIVHWRPLCFHVHLIHSFICAINPVDLFFHFSISLSTDTFLLLLYSKPSNIRCELLFDYFK